MHVELSNQPLSGARVKDKAMTLKLLATLSSLATAKFTQRRKNVARSPGGLRGGGFAQPRVAEFHPWLSRPPYAWRIRTSSEERGGVGANERLSLRLPRD